MITTTTTNAPTSTNDPILHHHTATIVAGYLARNPVPADQLPTLINSVYGSLAALGQTAVPAVVPSKPAVSVRKSITPEALICLVCGKKAKMLKRHIHATHGMTPDEYRREFGLAQDYPMVAPKYAAERSALAKQIGLGTTHSRHSEPAPSPVPATRGRRRGRPPAAATA